MVENMYTPYAPYFKDIDINLKGIISINTFITEKYQFSLWNVFQTCLHIHMMKILLEHMLCHHLIKNL